MIASRSIFLVLCFLGEMPCHGSCPKRSGPTYEFNESAARRPPLPAAPGRACGGRTQALVTTKFKWPEKRASY